jgi:hypothetical protein
VKYKASHPILVDAIPKGFRSRHLVGCQIESEFDIPVLTVDIDAHFALSFETPGYSGNARPKQLRQTHTLFQTENAYYAPLTTKDGTSIRLTNQTMVSAQLATVIAEYVKIEAEASHQLNPAPKLQLTTTNGLVSRASKVETKDLLRQPSTNDLPASTINYEALDASFQNIHGMITREFAIINGNLCKRAPEPFYAVVRSRGLECELKIAREEIPDGMIAAFKLGRLNDAKELIQVLNDGGSVETSQLPQNLREGHGIHSEFDDVGLTVANAGCKIFKMFKYNFSHEYIAQQSINRLMFETPLEHVAAARKLNDIIDNRGIFALAVDADRVAEVLEEVSSFGDANGPTPNRNWPISNDFPLHVIVDIWNNQQIDIDLAPKDVTRPRR